MCTDCRHEEETPSSKCLCDTFCLHVATIPTRNTIKLFTKFRFLTTIALSKEKKEEMRRLYKFEAGRPVAALKRHTSLLVIFHTGEFCSKCFCQVCDFFREEIGVVPFPTILEENNVEEMSERARRKVRLGLFTSVTF